MKLYICGNGFDIHNGFETKYISYRNYFDKYPFDSHYIDIVKHIENCPYIEFQSANSWSDAEKNLKIDYRKYFNDYCELYNKPRVKPGSFKFEKSNKPDGMKFLNDIYSFTGECFYYWLKHTYDKHLKINTPYPKDLSYLKNNCNDIFITFNYTTTLEDIYKIPSDNILYIHGCIKNINEENLCINYIDSYGSKVREIKSALVRDLQFGSADNNPDKIIQELQTFDIKPNNCMFSCKNIIDKIITYCKWSYKDIPNNYKKINNFVENKHIEEIIIIGHSIMGIDNPYYSNVFVPRFKNCKWTFYYYKDKKNIDKFIEKYSLNNCNYIQFGD